MAQILEFVTNHLMLVSAFCAVLMALLWALLRDLGSNAISPQQGIMLLNREGAVPVDIRNAASFRAGHIINALNFELTELNVSPSKLDKHKAQPLLLYCDTGVSSQKAVKHLTRAGFSRVHQLRGGLSAWRSENLPLEVSK
ncbi:MAG: rhodanese-like domain-containing protein [Gammaproteobacteria bacterium]|nr:rhodanese-like domain-containing protein [Gammaproteobacteria bacterium]